MGGDVFDVYRLSDTLAMAFIADVSGKGVDAAVLTAFIKFTIRGIALRRRDPGAMLAEFNTAFSQTVENPYLFVSMFVGVLDTQTLQFRYASAGHDSAFVRRADDVQQLAVTGPVLGVMEEPFETKTLYLEDGDTLVLVTDGLTEARNRAGEQLYEEGAMELIAREQSSAAAACRRVGRAGQSARRKPHARRSCGARDSRARTGRFGCVAISALARSCSCCSCRMRRWRIAACTSTIGSCSIGTTDDPDVFVWDSRFRLRDYEGGTFDQMKALLASRDPGAAGYARDGRELRLGLRAIEVRRAARRRDRHRHHGGPLRGQRGWVLGSAIRELKHGQPRKPEVPRGVSTRVTAIPYARSMSSGASTRPGTSNANMRSHPKSISRSA